MRAAWAGRATFCVSSPPMRSSNAFAFRLINSRIASSRAARLPVRSATASRHLNLEDHHPGIAHSKAISAPFHLTLTPPLHPAPRIHCTRFQSPAPSSALASTPACRMRMGTRLHCTTARKVAGNGIPYYPGNEANLSSVLSSFSHPLHRHWSLQVAPAAKHTQKSLRQRERSQRQMDGRPRLAPL